MKPSVPYFILSLLVLCGLQSARAQNILQSQLTCNVTSLKINAYQVATYSIAYTCSSTTTDAANASVVVTLAPSMELVSTQRTAEVTGVTQSGSAITFTFQAALPAGSTGQLVVQARFLGTTAAGTVAATRAAFAASNATTVNMGPINVTGTDPVVNVTPTLTFVKDIYVYKYGPSSFKVNSPEVVYYITHGNRASAGNSIPNYVIEDVFPVGLALNYFSQDRFEAPAPGLNVVVRYKTNMNGAWRQWGSGALYNTASHDYQNASDLGLSSGEYVTALRWEYGTVAGGGNYHPDNIRNAIGLVLTPMPGFGVTGAAPFNTARPLGSAQDYNAMSFGNLSGLADVEGGLAVGANLDVSSFNMANRLDASWSGRDTLVVGGALKYNGGQVVWGNAIYNTATLNNFTTSNGTKRTGASPLNFTALRTYWTAASAAWAALPVTAGASATKSGSTITINAANGPGLVVVSTTAANILGATSINVTNMAPGATLLVNVSGLLLANFSSTGMTINGSSGDPALQQQVLWNFPTLPVVNITSVGFQGSILAPKSLVSISNGNVHGHVIAGNISSSGSGEIHWKPFLGNDLPNPSVGTGYITTVQNCANATGTGYSSQSCSDSDIYPPSPHIEFWNSLSSSTSPAIGETFQSYLHLCQYPDSSEALFNPTFVSVVPAEFEYVDYAVEGDGWAAAGSPLPQFERLANTPGPGQTLLRWRWGGTAPLNFAPNGGYSYVSIRLNLRVRTGVVNGGYEHNCYAYWDTPSNLGGYPWPDPDTGDYDGDGNSTENRADDSDTVAVLTNGGNASLTSEMSVMGELDTVWSRYPANGLTVPGGQVDYRLVITNTGGVAIRNLTIIDVLPSVGDKGVVDHSPRGSQWEPFLVGAVTAPPGVSVFYSISRNPCRTEILGSALPAGCETPNWTTSVPADLTTVHSLKFEYSGADLMPSQVFTFGWPMRAPWSAPTAGEIAWNSFGYKATRADNAVELLPTEPRKTGVAIRPPDPPYYGDHVWADTNANGIQDSGERGINGVRVELWRDNGDNVSSVTKDTLVTFTLTTNVAGVDGYYKFGNIGPGNYFAVVMAPPNMGVSPKDRGVDDTDSDGTSFVYRSRRAAIMPVTNLTSLEEDLTWDQGFTDRSGIPAVWAIANQSDGKTVMGGRFSASHGVARNNIARVNADGTVDTSFSPGTGFNGVVRSLALRSDGSIWCGGNFTTYNGQPSKGVALLQSNGTWISTTARTDTSEINWVGTSGNMMYLAGRFSKCGGITSGNLARLNANGTVDTTWNRGVGADGEVLCGAVLTDGSVLIGGAFSTVHGIARKGIARLMADGSVDTSFDPGTGVDGEVYSIKTLEDGRMVLTGTFRDYNRTPCNGAIRISATGGVDGMALSSLDVESINSSD